MINNGNTVKIIDAIMGSGKTSWAIQCMNQKPNLKYIYVTPFLDEIERIIANCPACQFVQPTHERGQRKIESFEDLLQKGQNIATTHVTFSRSTPAIIKLIREQKYILILDEVIEVLTDFNLACEDSIGKKDLDLLRENNLINTDSFGQVHWIGESFVGSKYSNVERCAKNDNLFCIDGKKLIWVFPFQLFRAFEKVYIMTYLYEGSYLKPYMDYYEIPVEKKGMYRDDSTGQYRLVEYKKEDEQIEKTRLKSLIRFYELPKRDAVLFEKTALSATNLRDMIHAYKVIKGKTMHDRMELALLNQAMNPETIEGREAIKLSKNIERQGRRANRLKTLLRKYFREDMKAHTPDIMWTTLQDAFDTFKDNGYRRKELAPKDLELSPEEQAIRKAKTISFVPCNARATNTFRSKTVLAYLYNVYVNPEYQKFFGMKGIGINRDLFAVSALLQWVFRSAIRDDQPITLFLPSQRMRNLLGRWLDGKL